MEKFKDWNKVLYISIGVLCVLSIIAGIYAQFFVKSEDKNNVILPTGDQTGGDGIKEKTTEEIKAQFASLFINEFNSENYDTTNISKIVADKDIVYSAYDINEKKDNYEVIVHLPVINIKGEVATSFNTITQNIFANKASEILSGKSTNNVIYTINYAAYINGDILSLIIEGTLKDGTNPQRVLIQTYNYNLKTGEKAVIEDVLSQKNLVQSEVQDKINTVVTKAKEEAEILVQSGYTVYNRELNNAMYKLSNISNYFLGPNGELYIVFAYGNQNYTSEMDIVLFESENSNNTTSDNSTNSEK